MGRYILQQGPVTDVFESVYNMFNGLINRPTLDRQGMLNTDVFDTDELKVANTLLETLERLYPLKLGRAGNPAQCGVATESMQNKYNQMKYWQRMLNAIYEPKGEG